MYYFLTFKLFALKKDYDHINDDLLVKHLLGEASADEEKTVNNWLQSSAENAGYYRQLRQVWESSKSLAAASSIDENKAWERFQQRVSPAATRKPSFVQRLLQLKAAAILLLVAGAAITGWLLLNRAGDSKQITAQTAQNTLTDSLPDGSVVVLNKKSSIVYPNRFTGAARNIALQGEAFFSVTPNKEKPFTVTVNNIAITVVGTSFNIRAEKDSTEVIVETGIVRVSRGTDTTYLHAGEKLLLPATGGRTEKTAVTDHLYNYYRTKTFVCDDTPLWKLVAVLNKAYDADIIIGNSALRELKLNTTFSNEPLNNILEIIHLTFDITVSRKDGRIILQ